MNKIFYFFTLLGLLCSCTEPYLLESTNFEEALVIEATLTNELKTQTIKLSKSYKLEENHPTFVTKANVYIKDDLGNSYKFIEKSNSYESELPFKAIPNRTYQLYITTPNGKTYRSSQQTLTTENEIQSIEVSDRVISNKRGAEIRVKSSDKTKSSKYYRFEYEETYKIIAPNWNPYTTKVNPITKEITFSPRTYEARTCYSTQKSKELILVNTSNQSEDDINHLIRFIPVTDPIIKHRYSILVKQYVQNLESYTYYNTLKTISGSESILSPNQPGFLTGNIECISNPTEKVIGFFDVSSVSSKRIFFNFSDVFPNTKEPEFFYNCPSICDDLSNEHCPNTHYYCFDLDSTLTCQGPQVIDLINSGILLYSDETVYQGNRIIFLTDPPCGDCTKFSSNLVPSFWQ